MPVCATPGYAEECDRSSTPPFVIHRRMLGLHRYIQKVPSSNHTTITDLKNNNLADPPLTLFLTSDQLHFPKHYHRKFIPKQLGL